MEFLVWSTCMSSKGNQEYEEVKDESRRGKGSKQTVNGGKEGRKETKQKDMNKKINKNARF